MAELRMHRAAERAMVTGSGVALAGGAALFDPTVRATFGRLLTGGAVSEVTSASGRLQHVFGSAMETVGYQSSEHGTLTMFGVAAVVLFVCMIKT